MFLFICCGEYLTELYLYMNTNTAVIGGIVVILLLIGGIFFYTQSNPSPVASSTPTGATAVDAVTGGTTPAPAPAQSQPGAPTATTMQSVDPSDTAAIVVGAVIPNGASTNYWYEYGTTANLGSKSSNQNIGSGYVGLAAPAYISGLTKDTTYYFRVAAQNQFGQSAGATYSFHTTTGTPAPQGSAPLVRTLAAGNITRTSANVNGQVTANKSATNEWFEYGTSRDFGSVTGVQAMGNGSTAVSSSVQISGLNPATTYYFRLNAQNQFGTVNGTILSFKTSGPAAAAAVPVVTTQVAVIGTTTATLRGTVNPYGSLTNYWFEYSTSQAFAQNSLHTTPQTSGGAGTATLSVQADISGLRAGTTYYYRIVAQNPLGTVRGTSVTFRTK